RYKKDTGPLTTAAEKKLLAAGWRPGTLTLRLVVDQGGKLEERSSADGGTLTHIDWAFEVNLDQSRPVLVAPDLSRVSFSLDQQLSPIRFVQRSSLSVPTGGVNYQKRMLLSTPYS